MTDPASERRRLYRRRAIKWLGTLGSLLCGSLWLISRQAEVYLRWDRSANTYLPTLRLDSFALHGNGLHIVHAERLPVDRTPSGWTLAGRWNKQQSQVWLPIVRHVRGYWYIFFPLWPAFALCAIPAACLFWQDRTYGPGRCPRCGYDLEGLTAEAPCPECGHSPSSH